MDSDLVAVVVFSSIFIYWWWHGELLFVFGTSRQEGVKLFVESKAVSLSLIRVSSSFMNGSYEKPISFRPERSRSTQIVWDDLPPINTVSHFKPNLWFVLPSSSRSVALALLNTMNSLDSSLFIDDPPPIYRQLTDTFSNRKYTFF